MTVQAFSFSRSVIAAVERFATAVVERAEAFRADASGATAIEYGLLAAGISLVIVGTVFALGETVNTAFDTVATALQTAAST
jgi:pilus assembly protein Flp/PilA